MTKIAEETELPGEEQEDKELYEHHRFNISKGQVLIRIDKFLMNHIMNASRTKLQSAAEAGCILVNEKPVNHSKSSSVALLCVTFELRLCNGSIRANA